MCGWTLARAHARSGDARSRSPPTSAAATRSTRALARFAEAYADQNERDHAALVAALRPGGRLAQRAAEPLGR